MSSPYATQDQALANLLKQLSTEDEDFWSFRRDAERDCCHAYSQYPAMMVPKMQGELLKAVTTVEPEINGVFDPYVGSGTVQTEAMKLGLDFTGIDINPLAILLCRAKAGPFRMDELCESVDNVLMSITGDREEDIEAEFTGLGKWFQKGIAVELSRIQRAIRRVDDLWLRRFYWVALSETVRLSSNSRTSTFKLHIRPADEIEIRDISPIRLFNSIVRDNREHFCNQTQLLTDSGHLVNGTYTGEISLYLGDSRDKQLASTLENAHGILQTSPPYGDNVTTVPYGQYSFLPLQWIDHSDIDVRMDRTWISTTHEIDTRSLGGSKKNAIKDSEQLYDISPSFKKAIEELIDEPADRRSRVGAFCRDLNQSLDPILTTLKQGAILVWTVGNRRVAGRPVPIDAILYELLSARGCYEISRIYRKIPSKRMAVKNKTTETMRSETTLVLRKGAVNGH